MRSKTFVTTVLFGVALLTLCGCTAEKAQAVKTAAGNFQIAAAAALSQINTILKQNEEMPPLDVDKIAADLETSKFDAAMLEELLSEGQVGASEAKDAGKAIADIQAGYDHFAAMFEALPNGSYFASGDVDKAKKYAVNLTLQMVNLAGMLEQGKIQVRLNARRVLLVEQITQGNTISDVKVRRQYLQDAAKQILTLRDDEAKARDEAAAQCLKAAEAGNAVIKSIKDFDHLSVTDILSIGQTSLGFAAQISGQNAGVVSALTKYNGIATAIQSDPYWKPFLDTTVSPMPANKR